VCVRVCACVCAKAAAAEETEKKRSGLGSKVPCAPKCFGFEFSIIRTTKLLVETRSGT